MRKPCLLLNSVLLIGFVSHVSFAYSAESLVIAANQRTNVWPEAAGSVRKPSIIYTAAGCNSHGGSVFRSASCITGMGCDTPLKLGEENGEHHKVCLSPDE